MRIIKFLKNNFGTLLFSFILTFGFSILIYIHTFAPVEYFALGSVILFSFLVFEIVAIKFAAQRQMNQLNIPIVDRYPHLTEISLHVILPSVAYWSVCIFIFFEPNPTVWAFLLVGFFAIFFALLTNIRAYFEDKFKLEENTHYVYDLLKFVIFALLSFNIFHLHFAYDVKLFFVVILLFLLCIFLFGLNLLRYRHLMIDWVAIILVMSGFISVFPSLLFYFPHFTIFEIDLIAVLFFYISAAILHHKIKRDLTSEILKEYLVVAFMVLVMFVVI